MFANILNCSFYYSAAKKTGIKLCLMCNDVLNIPISMKLCWRVNTQKLEEWNTTKPPGEEKERHKKKLMQERKCSQAQEKRGRKSKDGESLSGRWTGERTLTG